MESAKIDDYQEILFEVRDNIAWITINRPEVRNAFREQTLDELIHAFKSTRNDASIAAAVVTGAGNEAFSSGGDFHAMNKLNRANASHWNDRMLGLAMTIRVWCDLVIASDNAHFGQTGAKVGACPTVGATQYIPRLIGERLAREMIFMCRTFSAEEAVQVGLINRCVPQDQLLTETEKWCENIKGFSGQTIRSTKKSLNFESDMLYASWQHGMELLAEIWGSEESLEGMDAFLEKRKPDFMQFRNKRQESVQAYLDTIAVDGNRAPQKT